MPKRTRPYFALAKAWLADASGGALTEFVIITPIAIAFIGLLIFAGQGLEAIGKVNLTARTVANLVTEQTGSVTMSSLNCLLAVATNVMTPFDTSAGLTIRASEVLVDSSGTSGVVQWSWAAINYGPSLPYNSTVNITTGALPAGSYQIYVETSYAISPFSIIGTQAGNLTLRRSVFLQPRNGSSIPCTDCPKS